MGTTLMKRYIKDHSLSVSEIAQQCHVSESYVSKIINNHTGVIRIEVLTALANYLGFSLPELNRLRSTLCLKTPQTFAIVTKEGARIIFLEYLEKVLDGIDEYDQAKIEKYHGKIVELKNDDIDIYPNYLKGYDGWRFALDDKFDNSIECSKEAQSFIARSELEMRFKSKLLGWLGAALIAKGDYSGALRALRQSLITWNDGGKQAGWIYLLVGLLYRRKGDFPLALVAYRKAQTLGNEDIRTLTVSAQILIKVHSDKCLSKELGTLLFAKMMENQGTEFSGVICCNLGEAFLRLEDFYRAEELFSKALYFSALKKDLHTRHRSMIGLGNTYLAKNDQLSFDKMVHSLDSEIREEADNMNVCRKLNLLSWSYMKNKQFSRAKRTWQKSYHVAQKAKLPFEMLSSCDGLKKCHKALREPAVADFYGGEETRIKKLIRIK